MSRLEARERFVLLCRLGMADGEPLILKEIGSKIGVSRERVRQIEQEARARPWRLYRRAPSVPAPPPRRGAFKRSRSRTPLAADGR